MRFELEQWLLTRPRPTQHGDVARLVRERISDDRRKMIDALTNVSRAIPQALSTRFISPADKTATPTASSGIVIQPAALARLQRTASAPTPTPSKRPAEDEETLLGDAARAALTPPPKTLEASLETIETVETLETLETFGARLKRLPWPLALAGVVIAVLSFLLLSR
jgi:hypothetical protein